MVLPVSDHPWQAAEHQLAPDICQHVCADQQGESKDVGLQPWLPDSALCAGTFCTRCWQPCQLCLGACHRQPRVAPGGRCQRQVVHELTAPGLALMLWLEGHLGAEPGGLHMVPTARTAAADDEPALQDTAAAATCGSCWWLALDRSPAHGLTLRQ